MPITIPPLVSTGQIISSAHINAIRNALIELSTQSDSSSASIASLTASIATVQSDLDIAEADIVALEARAATWTAHVDADGFNLSDVNLISFRAGGFLSGNVGVGAAPNFRFEVQGGRSVFSGNDEAFAVGIRYNPVSSSGFFLGEDASGSFHISTWGGTSRLGITSAGVLMVPGGIQQDAWAPLALEAGWSNFAGYRTGSYRKDRQNRLWIAATLQAASAADWADSQLVAVLPVGHRPTWQGIINLVHPATGIGSVNPAQVQIIPDGTVRCYGLTVGAENFVHLYGSIPLD